MLSFPQCVFTAQAIKAAHESYEKIRMGRYLKWEECTAEYWSFFSDFIGKDLIVPQKQHPQLLSGE